jgi:hypothetical protein
MRRLITVTILAAALAAAGCAGVRTWSAKDMEEDYTGEMLITEPASLRSDWEIVVEGGHQREYITTNKVATHFSCQTTSRNLRSYHGLYCAMHEYLDSWDLRSGGKLLNQDEIDLARAYPHVLYRWYEREHVMEEIFLPDFENGLAFSFRGDLADTCTLDPWVDMRFIWDVPRPDYVIYWEKKNNVLLISRSDDPFEPGRPRWIAITSDAELDFEYGERFEERIYPTDMARKAMGKTSPFTPGRFTFTPFTGRVREVSFAVGLGVDEEEAVGLAKRILENREELERAKIGRIAEKLHLPMKERPKPGRMPVVQERPQSGMPGDIRQLPPEYHRNFKAFCWARASMDNLIMYQRGRGIYAGFHWFPNYWGRDSFICLPGACLATEEFETARDILTSFMAYQQADPASPRLGRMPNIVNPDNLQYAGVDGTWWFVRAAWMYYQRTMDREFLVEAWPKIRLAIDGALSKAVDQRGFLTHGDGETWMDAGGESNPYSPRGDRAVEVQALFHHGLLAGSLWADEVAKEGIDTGRTAQAWKARAEMLARSFRDSYWWEEKKYLRDHLNRDGSADRQIRPNALLALWVYLDTIRMFGLTEQFRLGEMPAWAELVSYLQFRETVATAMETVIIPHGVTSLDPDDPDFKPLHLDLGSYYYDAAYHNGDVWEWLAGPAISCMVEAGEEQAARELFAPMVDEILEQACTGSLREIRDGRFIPGKEEFGGATSQAWSLAEFIRVALEELGLE